MDDPADEIDRDQNDSFVVFRLGPEHYALEVARVREVLDAATLTRVPGGPPGLVGLYNLRGHVVPVWDLRVPFKLDEVEGASVARSPGILMVEPDPDRPTRVAGLLVDRVSDVLEAAPGDVKPAPSLGSGDAGAFVRGVIHQQGRFLLVLDLDRVFEALTRGPVPEMA